MNENNFNRYIYLLERSLCNVHPDDFEGLEMFKFVFTNFEFSISNYTKIKSIQKLKDYLAINKNNNPKIKYVKWAGKWFLKSIP